MGIKDEDAGSLDGKEFSGDKNEGDDVIDDEEETKREDAFPLPLTPPPATIPSRPTISESS